MKLIIDKGLTNEALIKASPLFGQAVFVECGWHSPLDFCFDHHDLENTTYMLSSSAMIQQEVIRGRKVPVIIVMNHFRHLDNILAAFLFMNPELAVNPDVSLWALSADLIDRVGPIAFQAIDLPTRVLLQSIQEMIPLKEWQLTNTELREKAEEVLRKLRSYVVADEKVINVDLEYVSQNGHFAIVRSDENVNQEMYRRGFLAFAAYTISANGSIKWTLARKSVEVPFDLIGCYDELNILESGWGGRAEVGGSPKPNGSRLQILRVKQILIARYKED